MSDRPSALKKVTLHAARSKLFPDGSIRHGYEFIAPLTADGHIDLEAWKGRRGECFAHRFWGDEPDERGLLVHRAGGRGGSTWRFELGVGSKLDEEDEEPAFASATTHSGRANTFPSVTKTNW